MFSRVRALYFFALRILGCTYVYLVIPFSSAIICFIYWSLSAEVANSCRDVCSHAEMCVCRGCFVPVLQNGRHKRESTTFKIGQVLVACGAIEWPNKRRRRDLSQTSTLITSPVKVAIRSGTP